MMDIVAMREALIDFSPSKGIVGNPTFKINSGGAPAGCLATTSALGVSTAFIGMVGQDIAIF